MAVRKRGKYWYGDSQADVRTELVRYSAGNEYSIDHFAEAVCRCGGPLFRLAVDDVQGAAVRYCTACCAEHPIGDSDEFLADAEPEFSECACGKDVFEITCGVHLYEDSEDVRWFYVGCRCPACGLVGCYGDWKNEFIGYKKLLRKV